MDKFMHLVCPVCSGKLSPENQSLICSHGHCFDIAGKGYVNLLLVGDKNSKEPGDNKDMVKARKRFLDKGYYEPLAKCLCTLLSQRLQDMNHDGIILDTGCGDGYYTDYILRNTLSDHTCFHIYGMDISKEAIRLAAGRNKDIVFFVASLFKIPFSGNSADFILNAFAPSYDPEFRRILKHNGILISVIPGRSHLFGLKSVLYEKPYENDEKGPDLPSFRHVDQVRVKDSIKLCSREDIADLLAMTPYYWKTPKEGIERLNKLTELETPVEFVVNVYSKQG